MTPRSRRIAAALVALAALLFAGRWLAQFLADRWWAAAVAPPAAVTLTRRALLRLGLDLAGVVLSVLWFAAQAQAAVGAIRALPLRERGGNSAFRSLVDRPQARGAALLIALIIGVLVGGGTGEWADAVTLAGQGVTVGLPDPALGRDAGWYVARLPVWVRLQAFVTVLVLLGFGLVLLTYVLGGALRITRGLAISDEARVHLGILLALLASVIGTSQILAPFELAAGLPAPVASGIVELHRSVAFVLVGVSVAVAMLSIIWALRPLHSLVAGAWLALSAAMVGAYYLLPDTPTDSVDAEDRSRRREFERIAYGLAPVPRPRNQDRTVPSFWDSTAAAHLVGSDTARPGVASRGRYLASSGDRPVWVAIAPPGDSVPIVLLADDTTAAGGGPLSWRTGAAAPAAGVEPLLHLSPLAARPGASPVAIGSGSGVPAGNALRRLVMAWARQAPRIVGASSEERVGWLLDPEQRLQHLAPFAYWRTVRPRVEGGRIHWIVDGFVLAESFPVVRRVLWEGHRISYARAGFVGVVDAQTGTTRIYLRPDADPMARALAQSAAPLVLPAEQLPDEISQVIAYPDLLLGLQAELYAIDRAEAAGDSTAINSARPPVVVGEQPGRYLAPIVDRRTGRVELLLEGDWEGGRDRLWEYLPDSTSAPEAPDVLTRRWQRFSLFQQVRDSVIASTGKFETAAVRYAVTEEGLVAYQPAWALEPGGRASVVLVTVASGDRLGAGRTLEEAWRSSRGEITPSLRISDDAAAREEALRWLQEADSALRRGDLVGFARAFAALKSALQRDPPSRPK